MKEETLHLIPQKYMSSYYEKLHAKIGQSTRNAQIPENMRTNQE